MIGGGDWAADRIVPDTVRAAVAGEAVQVRNPKAMRPWQHVLEPLAGYLQLAERLCEAPGEYAEGMEFRSRRRGRRPGRDHRRPP